MRRIGLLLLFVACHVEPSVTPDAPVVPKDGPMEQPDSGMVVTWSAKPALPGPVTDEITVTEVTFQLEHLQLVSDAGADDRTTHTRYQLSWSADGGPSEDSFPTAPVGTYQRIVLDMRPGNQMPFAYQILGTWRGNPGGGGGPPGGGGGGGGNEPKAFRITDIGMLTLPVACSVSLPPGNQVEIAIHLNLRDALASVDFKSLPQAGGVLVMTSGPQLASFRGRLQRAFGVDPPR